MRFWRFVPKPDSLEEVLAVAVEAYDDIRSHEYAKMLSYTTMLAQHYAKAKDDAGKKILKAVMSQHDSLYRRFFDSNHGVDIDKDDNQQEVEDFRKLMEGTFLKVHTGKLAEQGALREVDTPISGPVVFNKDPLGELLR